MIWIQGDKGAIVELLSPSNSDGAAEDNGNGDFQWRQHHLRLVAAFQGIDFEEDKVGLELSWKMIVLQNPIPFMLDLVDIQKAISLQQTRTLELFIYKQNVHNAFLSFH